MQNLTNSTIVAAANNPVIASLFDQYGIDPNDNARQHSHYSSFERVSFELTALDLLEANLTMEKEKEAYEASHECSVIRREISAFEELQAAMRPFHGIC